MRPSIAYADLYSMLNDAEIAYLYPLDAKVPVRVLKADDPAPNAVAPLTTPCERYGWGTWGNSKKRFNKRPH